MREIWSMGLILGSGRSSRVGNGNPLYYSCLENSMDSGAWRAAVHGVTENWTWLSNWANTHKPVCCRWNQTKRTLLKVTAIWQPWESACLYKLGWDWIVLKETQISMNRIMSYKKSDPENQYFLPKNIINPLQPCIGCSLRVHMCVCLSNNETSLSSCEDCLGIS